MSGLLPRWTPGLTSLIVPAYNPGPVLRYTWNRLQDFVGASSDAWEIVFVCDGCTDGAAEKLRRWTARHGDRVRVLSHHPNRGKGYTVYRGLAAARGQWRLFTDIDLAYELDDVERLAGLLRTGARAAVACRSHPLSQMQAPAALRGYVRRRRWQGRLFAFVARGLLPLTVRDTQAGLKGFEASVIERLLPRVRCRGFEFDCELLTGCARLGVPIVEMPVSVRYESRLSTTNWRTSWSMLRGLWRIRRHWSSVLLPTVPTKGG